MGPVQKNQSTSAQIKIEIECRKSKSFQRKRNQLLYGERYAKM